MDQTELLGVLSRYGKVTTLPFGPTFIWHLDVPTENCFGILVGQFGPLGSVTEIERRHSALQCEHGFMEHEGCIFGCYSPLARQILWAAADVGTRLAGPSSPIREMLMAVRWVPGGWDEKRKVPLVGVRSKLKGDVASSM